MFLPDRHAAIVRSVCGTSRRHRAQRNVGGGFAAKIDVRIAFIATMHNSSPNTTAMSVSLSSAAILENSSETEPYIMESPCLDFCADLIKDHLTSYSFRIRYSTVGTAFSQLQSLASPNRHLLISRAYSFPLRQFSSKTMPV